MEENLYIYFLFSCKKLLISPFSIFSFLLYLTVSSFFQIIKDLRSSSSSFAFDFRHLSLSGIMKKAISSHNITNPVAYSMQHIVYKYPLLSYTFKNFICYLINHFTFSFLLQCRIFSSPNSPAAIFLVSRSLSHTVQCSKHNTEFLADSNV